MSVVISGYKIVIKPQKNQIHFPLFENQPLGGFQRRWKMQKTGFRITQTSHSNRTIEPLLNTKLCTSSVDNKFRCCTFSTENTIQSKEMKKKHCPVDIIQIIVMLTWKRSPMNWAQVMSQQRWPLNLLMRALLQNLTFGQNLISTTPLRNTKITQLPQYNAHCSNHTTPNAIDRDYLLLWTELLMAMPWSGFQLQILFTTSSFSYFTRAAISIYHSK